MNVSTAKDSMQWEYGRCPLCASIIVRRQSDTYEFINKYGNTVTMRGTLASAACRRCGPLERVIYSKQPT